MSIQPPRDSSISVTSVDGQPLIAVRHAAGSAVRYVFGVFLLAWLGGWVAGLSMTTTSLSSGKVQGNAQIFVAFWLVAWTAGGVMAMYVAYRLFRPSVPETLRLTPAGLIYDSGIPPYPMYFGCLMPNDYWKIMFPKRTRVELDRGMLETLRLRSAADGNRLTIDVGVERLDIARSASEIEREWLCDVLVKKYGISGAERADPR